MVPRSRPAREADRDSAASEVASGSGRGRPESATPRARRSGKRDVVLAAALRCFERDGFHRASMASVIEEAGVSAGTVYRYFASKTDLIRACAEEVFGSVESELQALQRRDPRPDPYEVVPHLVNAGLSVGNRFGVDLTRIGVSTWTEALRDPLVLEQVQRHYGQIRRGLTALAADWAHHAGVEDVDVEAVGQALFGAIPGFILQHLVFGDVTPERYGRGLHDLGYITAHLRTADEAAPDGSPTIGPVRRHH